MDGMDGLTQIVADGLSQLRQKKKSKKMIQRGTISGDLVYINGQGYFYTLAIDINISDDMPVWCEVTASGQAVIVGA